MKIWAYQGSGFIGPGFDLPEVPACSLRFEGAAHRVVASGAGSRPGFRKWLHASSQNPSAVLSKGGSAAYMGNIG